MAADHVTLRNALAIQIFPLEFPWTSRDDVPHSVLNRDLPGMVRMEEGQVSGPEVSTAWVGCGAQRTGPYSVLLVAGSGKPHGKSIEPWISRILRQLRAEMQHHFLSDLSPALTSPLSSMLVCLSSCLLDMSTWMGFNKPKIKQFLLTINRKQQLLILLQQKQNRE